MSLKSIIKSIGNFFAKLFGKAKDAFNDLPQDQKDAIIKGVNVSEIIKKLHVSGVISIVDEIKYQTGLSEDAVEALLLQLAKDLGMDTKSLDEAIKAIADKAENTITDNAWNELWQSLAKFAASYLSKGKADWITLGLGVIEFAYQRFIKGVK